MMRKHLILGSALALILAPALAACTSTHNTASPSVSAVQSTPSTPPFSAHSKPVQTASSEQLSAAVTTAQRAMTVFVSHQANAAAWWGQFKAFLDDQAQFAWEGTNPQLVPATKVTGRPIVSASSGATNATVLVPTNVGQYLVELDRESDPDAGAGAWLIHNITPPAGTH